MIAISLTHPEITRISTPTLPVISPRSANIEIEAQQKTARNSVSF